MTTKIGRISQLDHSTLLRILAGCNFINAEVTRLKSRVLKATIGAAVLAAIGYGVMLTNGERDPRGPLFVVFLVSTLVAQRAHSQLKKSYKGVVVKRVVEALGHGLTYRPESTFTKGDFVSMHLFDRGPEKFRAEDEVCGKKNAVTYSLQEIYASYKQGSGRRSREVIIFKGLVVRLDFNKNFVGHTVIVSNLQSRILGGLLGQSETRKGKEIVRLENPDFERLFSVYSTDQQQARYLLTPKLMELIIQAQAVLAAELKLSFHDNSMFVTVPQKKDRFEVSLFGAPVTPETTVGDLVEVVSLAERLVDTLQLETRIWTRV